MSFNPFKNLPFFSYLRADPDGSTFDNLICLLEAVSSLEAPEANNPPLTTAVSPSSPFYNKRDHKSKRKRISTDQTKILVSMFEGGLHFPTKDTREKLARQLNLSERTIQIWFQNKRQARKNKVKNQELCSSTPKLSIRWMKPIFINEDYF